MKQDWKLHHLAYVVRDLERALTFFEGIGLGVRGGIREMETATGAKLRVGTLAVGNVELEIFEPVSGDSKQGAFLAEHGEGVHHIAFAVSDIESEIKTMEADGAAVTMRGNPGHLGKIAFFDTGAVADVQLELLELYR